jgi:hypothetical protein
LALSVIGLIACAFSAAASAAKWAPAGHNFTATTAGSDTITFTPPYGGSGFTSCKASFGGTIPPYPGGATVQVPAPKFTNCTNSVYAKYGYTTEVVPTTISKNWRLEATSTSAVSVNPEAGSASLGFTLYLRAPGGLGEQCTTALHFPSISATYSSATKRLTYSAQAGTFRNIFLAWVCPSINGNQVWEGPITTSGAFTFTNLTAPGGPIGLVP